MIFGLDELHARLAMAEAIAHMAEVTSRASGGRVQMWQDVVFCDVESVHPYRNCAVPTRPLQRDEVSDLMAKLAEFYRRDWGWTLTSAFPLDVDTDVVHFSETEPIMVLDDRSRFDVRDIGGLVIEEVADGDGVVRFERSRAEMYPKPHLVAADAAELWTGDVLRSARLFFGLMDGEVVATAGSLERERVNEIICLATRPSHRGRGIARAMMRRAMDVSDKTPILYASNAATAAYERMGFRHVGGVDYWVPSMFEARFPGGWV